MLRRYDDHGRRNRIFGIARSARLSKHNTGVADVPRLQDHDCSFVFEILIDFIAKRRALLLLGRLLRSQRTEEVRQPSGLEILLELGVGQAAPRRLGGHRQLPRLRRQHDLAPELALELFQIRVGFKRRVDGFRLHRAGGAWRPGQRESDERRIGRLEHVTRETRIGPAAAERSPGLFPNVRESVLLEPFHHPVARRLEAGRVGQARSIDVGEIEDVLHDFGVFKRFGFDAMDGRQIDRFLGVSADGGQHEHDGEGTQEHAGWRWQVHRIELKPWAMAGGHKQFPASASIHKRCR